ncbi:MAG: hypothetical protein HC933_01540 [Pleurocapsa sp. SU_196_0]|nr:hypothetical protein [Pleurocapsa sp. SU_196_0]
MPKGFPRPRLTLSLSPLSEADTRVLLRSLLDGEIEPALEAESLSHALGNPWVLEERLKAMLESGAIQRRAGQYEWNRQRSPLPESLGELLKHRVQQLEGAALEFARAASILGRTFRFEDARALLDWSDDLALEALESLLRARVIAEMPGSNGEGFRFTHPLYTDILRQSLFALKSRRLHSRAAKLLSQTAEPLELAEHHLAAEEHAAALELAFLAGERAGVAFAYPQAERAYRVALESAQKLETANTATLDQQRLGLRARATLGEVLSFVGRNAEAIEHWLNVLEAARACQTAPPSPPGPRCISCAPSACPVRSRRRRVSWVNPHPVNRSTRTSASNSAPCTPREAIFNAPNITDSRRCLPPNATRTRRES